MNKIFKKLIFQVIAVLTTIKPKIDYDFAKPVIADSSLSNEIKAYYLHVASQKEFREIYYNNQIISNIR